MSPLHLDVGRQVVTTDGTGRIRDMTRGRIRIDHDISGEHDRDEAFGQTDVIRPRRYGLIVLFRNSNRRRYTGNFTFMPRREAELLLHQPMRREEVRILVDLRTRQYSLEQTHGLFRQADHALLISVPADTFHQASVRHYRRVPKRWPVYLSAGKMRNVDGLYWSFLLTAHSARPSENRILHHDPYSEQGWLNKSTLRFV